MIYIINKIYSIISFYLKDIQEPFDCFDDNLLSTIYE